MNRYNKGLMLSSLLALYMLVPTAAYTEPSGAFALELPHNWTTQRQEVAPGIFYIQSHKAGDDEGAHIDLIVQKLESDLPVESQAQVNDALATGFLTSFGAEADITKQVKSQVTFDGRKATRVDVEFKDEENTLWKGYIIAVTGKRNAILLMPYAKASDSAGFKLVSEHAQTLAVESRTPRAKGSAASGPLSKEALTNIAGKVKANMKREPMTKVIAQGAPPLTYGSIANFVNVIEILFDIQLTEAEFDATRERFIEFYNKADAEGKRILAEQGASLLQTLTTGSQAEIKQSREEGKAVFTNAFKNGAAQGIGYAQVMWSAIERRQAKLASTKSTPKKDDWDQVISEGDLDATMEMLYFMWVGAGRDASDVTMDDIVKIRTQIVQGLPEMDAQLQLMIANAPKIYAAIRQQWQAAAPAQRLAMAQQFSAALDEWGIGATSSFDQSNGGGGGSGEYSMNAQIAQNTAWNAAKTWSSSN